MSAGTENDARLRRGFWITLAAVSAWKIYASATLTLCYDETYYHYWSLHPQLSYFDHPPLTAWLMTFSGQVFGGSVWTVRVWPILFSSLVALIARATARDMFGANAGERAGILILLAPIFLGNGVVMTPDVPLSVCWVAAVFCAWRALQAEGVSWTWWGLTGVAAGLGFLSKYNMVLFFGGLILFFIVSPQDRKRVFLGCLIAGVVATLFFTPVIVWNVSNDFASFKYQLNRRMAQVPHGSALKNIGEYAAVLIGIASPVLGLLCFRNSAQGLVAEDRARRFCAVLFWSVVGVFAYSALKTKIQANWPMVAFATAICAVAGEWPRLPTWLRRTTWSVLLVATGLVCLGALWPSQVPLGRAREFTLTPKIAAVIAERKEHERLDFVCTSSHELFGVVEFYKPGLRDALWFPATGRIRAPWIDDRVFAGKSALLVSDHETWGKTPYFERVEDLGEVYIPFKDAPLKLHFWKGVNYTPSKRD